jgi:hypothetical protein
MKKARLYLIPVAMLLLMSIAIGFSSTVAPKTGLSSEEEASIPADDAFDKMMAVLTHKRCINCHPAGDRPLQGEDSHIHTFNVQRGADNHGLPALRCESCHQQENNDYSGVPGAPEWSLAPISMKWEGLSRVEIATSMLDPKRNGGRSLDDIVKHLTEHELVLWAWDPGLSPDGMPREKPPVPREEYIAAVKAWAAAGAPIPEQ